MDEKLIDKCKIFYEMFIIYGYFKEFKGWRHADSFVGFVFCYNRSKIKCNFSNDCAYSHSYREKDFLI